MAKKQPVESAGVQAPLITKQNFVPIKFSHSQLNFFKTMTDSTITTCMGPAGTAKTFIACYAALDHYAKGACKKIVLVKPAVESGDPLGFLPGTLHEKIAPFMDSYLSNMEKIIGKETVSFLISKGVIEMKSLSHIRGATEDEAFMIMDESQNSDLRQIILFVTRMGRDSKIVICGDTTQYDQYKRRKDFATFSKIMKGVNGVGIFEFTREDIVRNPMLIEITDRYEAYKAEQGME
jgi:phosphate starvation-inducible PhoH-like protein